ncbi:PadR family transcriptional regulator (plasmid) [Paenibacillus sp. EC2-1]|uniref:PadR family transcriptional regulator n=1 Tax=Paenibacillus sp. EC2-1 TaxID=3388665 RepID=UPI003BEF4155
MSNATQSEKKEEKARYTGAYNRLFPVKVSTNTFLTIYILHLLKKKGRLYGKEIIKEIEDRFQGSWKPSHGLVYPILRELEKEGLVTGEWLGDNSKKTIRVYEITHRGLKAFEEEKETHKEVFTQSYMIMETLMGDLYEDEFALFDDWESGE